MANKRDIQKIIRGQDGLSKTLIQTIQKFNSVDKNVRTVPYILSYMDCAKPSWDEFRSNHILIHQHEKDSTTEEYMQGDLFTTTEIAYLNFMISCRSEIDEHNRANPNPSSNEPRNSPIKPEIRLPSISIPKFNGDYQSWRSFYDLFSSIIHRDVTLSPVQKLHYLKTSVTGEAERLLRQFDVTNSNYLKAWEVLEKRYNNKRKDYSTCLQLKLKPHQQSNVC